MKVLVLCLKAFETMEFSAFVDVMGWARDDYECDIQVVTCGFQKTVTSTFGIPIQVDVLLDDVLVSEYAALAIPGGFEEYGFYEEAYHEKTLKLIQDFHIAEKYIASVCVAAFPLAKSGILRNRKATTYHLRGGFKQRELQAMGVHVVNEPVVVDDTIITSYCPQTAPFVSFTLLELLTSTRKAKQVMEAMGYE